MTDMPVREEYGMEFLKGKGFFSEVLDMTDGDVGYRYDPEHKLAYFEYETDDEIRDMLNLIKPIRDYEYYWFWRDGRLRVYQVFGENKWFTYNLEHSRISEYKKSKRDKLKKFNPKNVNVLFDVKDVIKVFYRRLWGIRIEMASSMRNDISDQEKILAAQRTIDRIMFVYFIGQKRILKMIDDRGKDIEYDIKKLFKFILDETCEGDSTKFYRFLNRLFFEYLNNERNDDLRIDGTHGYSLKVPFLNGGLFREHEIIMGDGVTVKESDLDIAYNWADLISKLEEYNWMLGDHLPAEEDEIQTDKSKITTKVRGNLTPEILGHIYEKFVITISGLDEIKIDELKFTKEGELKRGNKKIGAYYTPEVITRYIAENTIFPCIRDKLGIEEKYGTFGMFFEDNRGSSELLAKVGDGLKNMTILDPAVGSGAFLMAAGDLLVEWREKCGDKTDKYEMKKEIIVNNLYGVDIMDGAVDICKLRLWLWLISGTGEKIEPLPNIEYNIRCGNSLIGYVDAPTGEQLSLSFMEVAEPVQRTLVELEMRQMSFVRETVRDILKRKGEVVRRYKITSHAGDAERLRGEIEAINVRFRPQLDEKLFSELPKHMRTSLGNSEEFARELNPFHWGLEFYDVFDPELPEDGRGFDVVIGNPPYGNLLSQKEKDALYNFKTRRANEISANFIEQQIKLLKLNSYLGNITTGAIIINEKTAPAHEIIRKNMSRCDITFFNTRPSKVFDGVEIRVSIILGKKDKPFTEGIIFTTDAVKFTKDKRESILNMIRFESTEGLFLGEKIGLCDGTAVTLPKVGYPIIRHILLKLRESSSKRILKDSLIPSSANELEFRKTGRYWLNALPNMPYTSTKIERLYFQTTVERDFCILSINSSLFYLYWSTYGNLRDLPKSIVEKFPVPTFEELQVKQREITKLREKISKCLLESFNANKGSVGEFNTAKCKTIIDDIDTLLGDFFGFTKEEIKFIQTYDQHVRPCLG